MKGRSGCTTASPIRRIVEKMNVSLTSKNSQENGEDEI